VRSILMCWYLIGWVQTVSVKPTTFADDVNREDVLCGAWVSEFFG